MLMALKQETQSIDMLRSHVHCACKHQSIVSTLRHAAHLSLALNDISALLLGCQEDNAYSGWASWDFAHHQRRTVPRRWWKSEQSCRTSRTDLQEPLGDADLYSGLVPRVKLYSKICNRTKTKCVQDEVHLTIVRLYDM